MKKILSIALISSLSFAAGNLIMPYAAGLDYSKESIKDYGYVIGAYYSKFVSPIKFEVDVEHTFIKYKNYSSFIKNNKLPTTYTPTYNDKNYKQYDITAVLNFYKGYNWAFKIGNHSIFIDQKNNDDSYDNVAIAGIEYYKYLKYNVGGDFYYSSYDGFNVKQFSPYIGFNFGNYYSPEGSFYLRFQVNFIKLSNKNITGKDNYTNYNVSLSNYLKNWTTTLKASFGKSAYKVENGGFVIYNLGEEYKGIYGIDIKYTWNKVNTIGIGYTYSRFNDIESSANSSTYLLSYSRAF
jgi:hypothetical protein